MQKWAADNCFISFQSSIEEIALPEKFTFPFYYTPHPLCEIAAKEVQELIESQDWDHDFVRVGKMFGVLVVKDQSGNLGYLTAFSGKLGDANLIHPFVEPVFDRLIENNHYQTEEAELNGYSDIIKAMQEDPGFEEAKTAYEQLKAKFEAEIKALKDEYKSAKKIRKQRKEKVIAEGTSEELDQLNEQNKTESLKQQHFIKKRTFETNEILSVRKRAIDSQVDRIQSLKKERKQKSGRLQKWLFDQYSFLTIDNDRKSLWDIFKTNLGITPPAGAGDCAAPKLLQHAFSNNLTPIALAEFWWGEGQNQQIRQHKNFYPSCRGKCEPILGHMLKGMNVDDNPMLINPAEGKELEIFFEDDHIVVVNKPSEFLSVPGKTIKDSVLTRLQTIYPDATGPLLVHRLDMSTSGILIAAKTKKAHDFIQKQFINRTIKKRYTALLDGIVKKKDGIIDLPLRVDLDNRPCQLVCFEHGKSAQTKWEKVKVKQEKTKVSFYPITGRTHQLRVHAAHKDGLGTPIIGDDLYGSKSDRLHLHAEYISLIHPETRELIEFTIPANF